MRYFTLLKQPRTLALYWSEPPPAVEAFPADARYIISSSVFTVTVVQ